MKYIYTTTGTCSKVISFDIKNNIITNIEFTGGCPGNLLAISKLVNGMTVEEIETKLKDIKCGFKDTSCANELAKAVREAYDKNRPMY
ncbi:MAG: TIGR03905 family TSCPD domain-containing protein [Firmicutes bacterium]|nr:TIGR03905 family TSCPD domain-containing protein [Bacillota bacterium]